ncbi:MFS transporter [Agrobacterium rhizogenes]|nr:MFS transporter [Rhizobium rhizogenes]NTG31998.1 MFS transporter [Rhizobium rhizogenes]
MNSADLAGQSSVRRLYLFCVTSAAAGRNAYFVLAAWIAVDVSQSIGSVATLLGLGSLAELLTSNIGGALVDRLDRRMICASCDLLRLILMVMTGIGFIYADPLIVLYASWIVYTIIDRTYSASLQALIPSIVEPEELPSFNSRCYMGMQAGNLVAALVVGFVLSAVPRQFSPLLASACFVLSLAGMMVIRRQRLFPTTILPEPRSGSFRRLDLLPTTLKLGRLKASAITYALIYAMGMLVSVLGSGYVIHELGGTARQFGYLEAGWAAGSIAGCAVFTVGGDFKRKQSILAHLVIAGLLLSGFWLVQSLVPALIQMMILGLSYNIARVLIDLEVQSTVPDNELGRARSQIHTVCVAIGLLVYGIIAAFGKAVLPSEVFGVFGIVMIAVAVFVGLSGANRGVPFKKRFV